MNELDGFNEGIDKVPWDWTARLVMADWMADNGNKLEEGYRAIVALKVRPCNGAEPLFDPGNGLDDREKAEFKEIRKKYLHQWWWCDRRGEGAPMFQPYALPEVWAAQLPNNGNLGKAWMSRREAEDVAAMVWLELPALARAEILKEAAK